MAFVLPTFNVMANVWHAPNIPTDPPDLVVECQIRGPSHDAATTNPTQQLAAGVVLLFPAFTDVRDTISGPNGNDFIEAPAGSGRVYEVFNVDDIAKGFNNEHRFAIVNKVSPWPYPIP